MKEVILIMFILACVRPFTGGYHEYSHKRCLIATMTLAYFIILISKNSNLNNISTILLNIVNIFSIYHQSHIINTYMNITKESLEQEMEIYQRMIEKYQMDPEYVNPNCSEKQARVILARLQKEYYTSYRID